MTDASQAQRVSAGSLPVIDVSGLSASDPSARRAAGAALREACLYKGFFYCMHHGIPAGLIEAVFAETEALFDQPLDAKMAIEKGRSSCNRGYEVLGGQVLETGGLPDRKEGFYIGVELPEDDPRVQAGRFNRGPNQWPADMPGFKPVVNAYFAAMLDLGERLMRGIALSLICPRGISAASAAIRWRRCGCCTIRRRGRTRRRERRAPAFTRISVV